MIAAVLTCVFVIYLYRKLRSDPGQASLVSRKDANRSRDVTDLVDRLSAMEARLKRLADRSSQEMQS